MPGLIQMRLFTCLAAILAATLATTQPGEAQSAGGYEPPMPDDHDVHYEKTDQHVGRFTIVRNVADYRAAPILHGPWLTKEARLDWHDSTGTIGFSLTDDGGRVRLKAEGRSADGQTVCIMQDVIVDYDPAPCTADNWRRLQPSVIRHIRACPAIAPADLARALAEMSDSTPDYAAAANAWKAVSANLFGPGGRRCIAERTVAHPTTLPPRTECTRYSNP